MEKPYEMIYEDKSVLVISKAHGVYVIPDRRNEHTPLIDMLRADFGEVYVTHRIDAGTGGLMVFAKNKSAHRCLSSLFAAGLVKKTYLAVTKSAVYPQSLSLPVAFGGKGRYKINFKSGKRSVTSFFNIDTSSRAALLAAIPLTGRTHQIRVHLKSLKAPLYQDFLYNPPAPDKRLTLQCFSMEFLHPDKDIPAAFTAPVTDFMGSFISSLELSAKNVYQYAYDA